VTGEDDAADARVAELRRRHHRSIRWYIAGSVATLLLSLLLVPVFDVGTANATFCWGAVIGIAIRENRQTRQDPPPSLDPERRWVAPTLTLLLTTLFLGLGLLMEAVLDWPEHPIVFGLGVALFGAAAAVIGVLYMRLVRRKREADAGEAASGGNVTS
jgi:O-antigen/teichoic acid export membrane protein